MSKKKFKRKQQKDYSWAFAALILFLMIGSVFGFITFYNTDSANSIERYNGYVIQNVEGRWVLNLEGQEFYFYNHPLVLEGINFDFSVADELMDNNPIFVTFDPVEEMLGFIDQIRLDLSLGLNAISAIANESTYYPNLEVVTCSDVDGSINQGNETLNFQRNIIYLKYGNNTGIRVEDSCVIIEGRSSTDFAELKDRLIYTLYGVMNG